MKILLASLAVAAVLAANAAQAGPFAPAPRVVAKYERDFIERSGAQTLEELLETGITRYFLTGGQPLLVLVNGRPYFTTSSDLDPLPLSAIERIELLSGDSLGTIGGSAVRGALNIVLRNDLDGVEVRAVARAPTRAGGDGWQGSAFWGGAVGEGRMTVGVDVLRRQEITSQSRAHSRSAWTEGGAFNEAQNVSVGGNTVWVVKRDETDDLEGFRSVALGRCDPADGYTGALDDPPGAPVEPGDQGCGFAYGTIAWNTVRYDQQSAILNFEHPVGDEALLHVDANFTAGDSAYRYAPPVGEFLFFPNVGLRNAILDPLGPDFTADENDLFVVAHRFVRHGNRDWRWSHREYDVSARLTGRLTENLGYDVRVDAFRLDGSLEGNTFVHEERIAREILLGNYDLEDPFSNADEHQEAIRKSSLTEEQDFASDYQGVRLALEGDGFAIGGRHAAWTSGVQLGRAEAHDLTTFRAEDDTTHDVSEVLGSGGASYAGRRSAGSAFAEMSLPVLENLDLRLAGRGDDFDDVGGMRSWRLGAEFRATDLLTLRSSWSAGERTPSLLDLHSSEVQDHPYIDCDPGTGPPPRPPCTVVNSRQVTRVTSGNEELDPSSAERVAIGAEVRKRPWSASVEWYRLSRSDLPGQNSADWSVRNLETCGPGDTSDCIERAGSRITILDRYENVEDNELTGFNTRIGGGVRTSWGVAGMRAMWRRVTSTDRRISGEEDRVAIPENVIRVGFLARRGALSAVWTASYRSGYENRTGTGSFDSWTGHDLVLDWSEPLGIEDARVTAGVFNLTDEKLSVNTANPSSVDGPTEASWGRTFFVTVNMQF